MIDAAPTTSLVSCRINWEPYIRGAIQAVIDNQKIEEVIDADINGNDAPGHVIITYNTLDENDNLEYVEGAFDFVNDIYMFPGYFSSSSK